MKAKICLIIIFVLMICFVSNVHAQNYTIKSEHPRIWLTPEKMSELKNRVAANTPEWQRLKNNADKYLTTNITGFMRNWYIIQMALMYQVTDDTRYSNRTKEFVLAMINETPSLRGDSYRNFGQIVPLAYDWIYDQLNASEKQTFVNAMNAWFDSDKAWWGSGRPSDTDQQIGNMKGAMYTAIATYGDNPRADGIINWSEDATNGQRVKYWLNEMQGGVWPEGSVYSPGTLSYLIEGYAQALKSVMNRDFWTEMGVPNFPKEVLYAKICMTLPGEQYLYPYGEAQGITEYQGQSYREHLLFAGLVDQLKGTQEGEYAQYYLKRIWNNTFDSLYYAYDFIWFDNSAPEADYKNQIPTDYIAYGNGYTFSRTDWTASSTYIGFQTKILEADHQQGDAGSFQIFRKGVWITKEDTGYTSGWQSWYHNTFLINEENTYVENLTGFKTSGSQLQFKSQFGIGITKFESKTDYSYMVGDVGGYYWVGPKYCETCQNNPLMDNIVPGDNSKWVYKPTKQLVRSVIYLKPDYFVIFDQVETTLPELSKQSVIHFYNEPSISGDLITSVNRGQKLFTKVLSPANPVITKYDETLIFPAGDQERHWQARIKPSTQQALHYFLTVFQGADETETTMISTTKIDSTDGLMVGAHVNDRIVMFSKNATISSTSYTVNGTGAAKHLITGMKPNTYFNVRDNGAQIYTNLKSSDNGTLNFTTNLGSIHDIFIFEATLASCSSQGGFICTVLQTCGGTWLPANDTDRCCSVACASDTTLPAISNVRNSTVTNSSTIILWSTDEKSDSVVYYGTTPSLGQQKLDASLVTSHSIQLTTLSPSTHYYYNVSSCDISGNCANSSQYTFTTLVVAPPCTPATEICGDGVDEDCSGADLACVQCGQGLIPSTGCTCSGMNYYSGYCCNNVYKTSPCTAANYTKLTIKGKVRKNTIPPQACYPDCKVTITFVDSQNATNTATAFNYTLSDGNFTLTLLPTNKFSSGYHLLKILIEKDALRSSLQRRIYIR